MPRPQSVTDLKPSERVDSKIMTINMSKLPALGSVLRAVGDLIESMRADHYVVISEYDGVNIYAPKTPEQLEETLHDAQTTWDKAQQEYEALAAQEFPIKPDDWTVHRRITDYCASEGLAIPWQRV